jgi:hypothetical protein
MPGQWETDVIPPIKGWPGRSEDRRASGRSTGKNMKPFNTEDQTCHWQYRSEAKERGGCAITRTDLASPVVTARAM